MTAAAAASPTPTIPITTAAWAGPPSGDRCLARAPNAHAAPDMGIENRNDVPSDISSSPTLSTPSTTAAIARPLLSGRAVGAGVHARASMAVGGGSALGGCHPGRAGGSGGSGGDGSNRGGACPPGARGGSQPPISWSSAIAAPLSKRRRGETGLEALAERAPAVAERRQRPEGRPVGARARQAAEVGGRRHARPHAGLVLEQEHRARVAAGEPVERAQLVTAHVVAVLEEHAPVQQRVHGPHPAGRPASRVGAVRGEDPLDKAAGDR